MIIKPDGTIRHLTVEEHLQRSPVVYQDKRHTIVLTSDKKLPFRVIEEGKGENIYIDIFALRFGKKEHLTRRRGSLGHAPIRYGCERRERDRILFLPVDTLVDGAFQHTCSPDCQYYSPPTAIKSRYAFPCILMRYRMFGRLDMKSGFTLEEVSRIYGCTRERIRQIQDRAFQKLRHPTRIERLDIFRERVSGYRDLFHPFV